MSAESTVTSVPESQAVATDQPISFEMNGETGILEGVFETPAAEPAPSGTPAPDTPAPTPPPAQAVDWEKRYKDLQSFSDRRYADLSAKLDQLESKVSAPAQADPGAAVDAELDQLFETLGEDGFLSVAGDPKKARAFFRTLTEKVADARVRGLEDRLAPLMSETAIRDEYAAALVKYGQAFLDAQPMIRAIINRATENKQIVTFEQAFEIASSISKSAPTSPQDGEAEPGSEPTPTPAVPPTPAPQPAPAPAADLAARAARLADASAADTGRAGSVSEPPTTARTTKEAFEAALRAAAEA